MSYALVAWLATAARRRNPPTAGAARPPITVLKPLCGVEGRLDACLRSFCRQHYPVFQIVFGVQDANDPAIAVVRRLQCEFPDADLAVSISSRQWGNNRKVSNLINMMTLARHPYLIIADSDVLVGPDYLAQVTAPLAEPQVGIVTCAYRGRPARGVWSLLGSLFINDWFMPSAQVAAMFGSRAFAFGATIAMRREALDRIGGLQTVADQLADDYRLGELTRRAGLRTVLSDLVVDTCVEEHDAGALLRHELRWLRTIRVIRPLGYALCFITFSVPVTVLGSLLAGGTKGTLGMLITTVLARVMLHRSVSRPLAASYVWALALSDLLGLALWCWAFVSREVQWRDTRYQVSRGGSVRPLRTALDRGLSVALPIGVESAAAPMHAAAQQRRAHP